MSKNLPGTYELVKYGYQYKDRFEPISDWYRGTIHYAETGQMSVVLRFAEKPVEFSEIVAYCGSYRVEGSKIVHEVTTSVRPEYEGQRLDRDFILEGDLLELVFENTAEFKKSAFWKRKSNLV